MIRTPWNFSRTRVVQIDKKGKVVLGAVGRCTVASDGTTLYDASARTIWDGSMFFHGEGASP